ncbi:hypothetical protein J1605_017508 [Eschrichtius robustus]|uniref:Uncharacterized protein n=1 Tax=Eschrichtius robustus TaxID=9764 RepID=A0AB34I1V4_ESCRO|nr:hypothetical protein J1605_017508 [Eschrichtius robustus]
MKLKGKRLEMGKPSESTAIVQTKEYKLYQIQAAQARLHYLSRFIKKTPDAECVPMSESQTKEGEEGQ